MKEKRTFGLPYCIKMERNDLAKMIRRDYDKGLVRDMRRNLQSPALRLDGTCGALTTVQKDNLILVNA